MRFITIFILFIGVLLAGCKSLDTKLSQQCIGTWTSPADLPHSPDGGFISWKLDPPYSLSLLSDGTCLSSVGKSKHSGRWVVKNGKLVMDFTLDGYVEHDTDTIIRVDDHSLTYAATNGERISLKR